MLAAHFDDFMKETRFAKLHPAPCFAFFASAIGMAALVQHPFYLAASLLSAVCLNISISGIGAIKRFLTLIPLWLVLSVINPLLNTLGEHILFSYWGRNYTLEALCYGMVLSGMFIVMIEWFLAYNAVMTEDKFSYLFASLAPSLAQLLTMVLRMIPNLMRKAKQISSARKCIGMGDGAAKNKLSEGMTNISALTSWALEGSVVTSDSMNSRGYGTGKRSNYHSYHFGKSEIIVSGILSALLLIALISVLHGSAAAEYTPKMQITSVSGKGLFGGIAYLLFLFTPAILNWKEEIEWSISRSKI